MAIAGAVFAHFGGAVTGAALTALPANSPAVDAAVQQTFIVAFRTALLVCAAFATLGAPIALVRGAAAPPDIQGTQVAVLAEATALLAATS